MTIDDTDIDIETGRLALEASMQIRKQIKATGLSQSKVAARLGLPRSRITRVLDGEDNFTLRTLAQFGLACGIRWTFTPIRAGRTRWLTTFDPGSDPCPMTECAAPAPEEPDPAATPCPSEDPTIYPLAA